MAIRYDIMKSTPRGPVKIDHVIENDYNLAFYKAQKYICELYRKSGLKPEPHEVQSKAFFLEFAEV